MAIAEFNARNPKYYVARIRRGYDGRVVRVYNDSTRHYLKFWVIQTNSGELIEESNFSDTLYHFLQVGDMIMKVPNLNYCYVIRNGKARKFMYTDVPEHMANDFRWPDDLETKWT